MNQKSAIQKINSNGVLLVFPMNNAKVPFSLWSAFYPRSRMRWDWDDDNDDDRVPELWHLMKRLSENREVVYSKWYKGRATFFSRELYRSLLRIQLFGEKPTRLKYRSARELLDVLESNSPLSTRVLKAEAGLQGKIYEGEYSRGLKELFESLLAVGFGEVDDGAFPSLAVGATRLIHEELWTEAETLDATDAWSVINRFMPEGRVFRKFWDRVRLKA